MEKPNDAAIGKFRDLHGRVLRASNNAAIFIGNDGAPDVFDFSIAGQIKDFFLIVGELCFGTAGRCGNRWQRMPKLRAGRGNDE